MELGTYYGESYFAFCQAITELEVECSAFAVDTWRGDIHTGQYTDEVFAQVDQHNRTFYSGFSRLLRSTFDDALHLFPDEGIDLLHIDGMHTYEALRHDFETWFPKVRTGGIILLHDTAVVADNFGVWRLWEELERTWPAFVFQHSSGLGVILKPGDAPADGIAAWMFGEQPVDSEAIRTYYELCADRLELRRLVQGEQTPESWGFQMQVFWRFAGHEFSQQDSIRQYASVSKGENTIRVALPDFGAAPAELRVDFSSRRLLAQVESLRLIDCSGSDAWRWEPGQDTVHSGMQIMADGDAAIFHVAQGAGTMILPVDEEALRLLASGGTLEMRARGLGVDDCLGRLLADNQASWRASQEALAAAERLAVERLQELRRYDEALHSAHDLIAERDAAVERLTAAFAHAERLAVERQRQLETYDRALCDAQGSVLEREKEIERLTAALSYAERLAVERQQQLRELDGRVAE